MSESHASETTAALTKAATSSPATDWKYTVIAVFALVAIFAHVMLRYWFGITDGRAQWPLWAALVVGGLPMVWDLIAKVARGQFGADLLAGISIVASVLLGEYLAGTLVVLMLSGGEALEAFAVRSASSVLAALARRLPLNAHRKTNADIVDITINEIAVGDLLVIFPHEVSPVDGTVVEGHGVMDESFLTGEPYQMSKTPGSDVLSGAINGEEALTIRATKLARDSRYAQIMQVMQATEERRPRLRRLGDQLGAWYTPLALLIAGAAWWASGEALRFLAVLVVATPCPLLIAIPVAVLGSISLSARRGIIIKNPAILEQVDRCRTLIFDKTGTLTYGEPKMTERIAFNGFAADEVLCLAASLERYSKHPLASAIQAAARTAGLTVTEVSQLSEAPGTGLRGLVGSHWVQLTSRDKLAKLDPAAAAQLPPAAGGLECVVLVDERLAAVYRFRDQPRTDGASFIHHLRPKHGVLRALLVSGDRETEVRYLAERVGISEVFSSQSPEDKVNLVRRETALAPTLFLGDGINDAPALVAATVGIAFGQKSEVTSAAADAVILDTSLERVDELLHIGRRMRMIALQSAVGGMALSLLGMAAAAAGYLPPVAGAILQEAIDVFAVLNALRAAWPPKALTDYED